MGISVYGSEINDNGDKMIIVRLPIKRACPFSDVWLIMLNGLLHVFMFIYLAVPFLWYLREK